MVHNTGLEGGLTLERGNGVFIELQSGFGVVGSAKTSEVQISVGAVIYRYGAGAESTANAALRRTPRRSETERNGAEVEVVSNRDVLGDSASSEGGEK